MKQKKRESVYEQKIESYRQIIIRLESENKKNKETIRENEEIIANIQSIQEELINQYVPEEKRVKLSRHVMKDIFT